MELIQCEMQTAPLNPFLVLGRSKPQWRITKILSPAQMYAAIRYENNAESWKKGLSAHKNPIPISYPWKVSGNKNQFFWFFSFLSRTLLFLWGFGLCFFFLLNYRKWKTWIFSYSSSVRDPWRSCKNRVFSPVQFWTLFYSLVGRTRTPCGLHISSKPC